MDSMFHESVVLCESDSDCKMYSIVFEYVKGESGSFLQTQFIHCGGKARMADVSKALKNVGHQVSRNSRFRCIKRLIYFEEDC